MVKIIPKTKRAKNRVKEHGDLFVLKKESTFQGEKAILVETNKLDKDGFPVWFGWFKQSECEWIPDERSL